MKISFGPSAVASEESKNEHFRSYISRIGLWGEKTLFGSAENFTLGEISWT